MSLEIGEFGSPFEMQRALRESNSNTLIVGAGTVFPDVVDESRVRVGLNVDPRQHELLCEDAGDNEFAVLFDLRTLAEGASAAKKPDKTLERWQYFRELFGDCRFDVLKFTNVFGEEPSKGHYKRTPINPSGTEYSGYSLKHHKLSSLRIASELLLPGGMLHIQEFQTPSLGMAPDLLLNPQMLEEFGYTAVELSLMEGESIADQSPPFSITATRI